MSCVVLCIIYLLANQTQPKSFAKLTSLNKLIPSGNLITGCVTPQSLGLSKDFTLCMRWNTTSTNWKIMSLFKVSLWNHCTEVNPYFQVCQRTGNFPKINRVTLG